MLLYYIYIYIFFFLLYYILNWWYLWNKENDIILVKENFLILKGWTKLDTVSVYKDLKYLFGMEIEPKFQGYINSNFFFKITKIYRKQDALHFWWYIKRE